MTQTSAVASKHGVPFLWTASVLAVLAALIAAGYWWFQPTPPPEGVSQRDYDVAVRRFRDLYGRSPSRLDVLSIAGELAIRDGRLPAAVACFQQIPSNHPRYGASSRLQQAQVLLQLNQAEPAEQNFREYLELEGTQSSESVVTARKWLTYILSVQLRFEDRQQSLADAHESGTADVNDSKQFFFPNLLLWNSAAGKKRLAAFIEAEPRDLTLRVAQGRYLTGDGQLDASATLLEELHRQRPESRPCLAALLESHFEKSDWKRFSEVANLLPPYEPTEPWLLTRMRAEFALQQQRWDDAVREFEHLAKAEPANPWSCMGLARAYGELNQPAEREKMLARSLILSRIRVSLSNIREDNPASARKLADECRLLGLEKAAAAFDRHAQRIGQPKGRCGPPILEE